MRQTCVIGPAIVALAIALAFGGCGGHNMRASSPRDSASEILHEPTGGVVGFAFLPPLAPDPGPADTFDGSRTDDLRVEVCAIASDGSVGDPVVYLPGDPPSGSADDTIRVDLDAEHYIVNLHTDCYPLGDDTTYRIFVRRLDGAEYGYADVELFPTMKEAKSLADGTVFALLDGRTLPIKFRIGAGTNPWLRKIAFVSGRDGNREIYVMREDGSDQTRLTFDSASDREPAWSPDGRTIAFVSWRGNTTSNIWVMNADGTGLTQLTYYERQDAWPSWSPDGQRIAFARSTWDSEGSHRWQIWVMNADGSGEQQLTSGPLAALMPDWSPDGRRIVFKTTGTTRDIWAVDADGGSLVNITQTPLEPELGPRWSPDGSQIVFYVPVPDDIYDYNVCLMDADGGDRRQLTNSSAQEAGPSWSPDGTRILFHSNQAAGNNQSIEYDLYTMTLAGTDLRRITTEDGAEWAGVWR